MLQRSNNSMVKAEELTLNLRYLSQAASARLIFSRLAQDMVSAIFSYLWYYLLLIRLVHCCRTNSPFYLDIVEALQVVYNGKIRWHTSSHGGQACTNMTGAWSVKVREYGWIFVHFLQAARVKLCLLSLRPRIPHRRRDVRSICALQTRAQAYAH